MSHAFQTQPVRQGQRVLDLLPHLKRIAQHTPDGEPFAAEGKLAGAE